MSFSFAYISNTIARTTQIYNPLGNEYRLLVSLKEKPLHISRIRTENDFEINLWEVTLKDISKSLTYLKR